MTAEAKVARCKDCDAEFTEAEIAGRTSCPACGSKRTPIDPREDVTLVLNWHDLRCLANWAENWIREKCADDKDVQVYLRRLLDRIRRHKPEGAAGLTIFDEIGELHDHGINATLTDGASDVLMKPPVKH